MTSRNVLDFAVFILYASVAYSISGLASSLFALSAVLAFILFIVRLREKRG